MTNFTNPDDSSKMLEIQVQASSLALLQEKSISFYKLASNNVTTGNYSCTAGDQMSFDSFDFDPQSPNVFLVVSEASNTVEIYEARGRGLKFKCKNQGRL